MRILLLRHGETAGNLEKRYVGRTDEGLTEAAIQALRQTSEKRKQLLYGLLGPVAAVYASPMRRCLETAALVFPEKDFSGVPVRLVPGLSECDFGRFEYKNYRELSGDADYQRFIDSGGTDGFPGGEAVAQFKGRCADAFRQEVRALMGKTDGTAVFVIHGGSIMAVLEAFGRPEREYYSWQTGCLSGYLCRTGEENGHFCLTDVAKISII